MINKFSLKTCGIGLAFLGTLTSISGIEINSKNLSLYHNYSPLELRKNSQSTVEYFLASRKSDRIQQGASDTCAIRSQQLILRDFGIYVSESELVEQAMSYGWYYPGEGTDARDVGNLLELYGVQVNRYQDADIDFLAAELEQGKRIIIGVDSGELWHPASERGEDYKADHSLLVVGIDYYDRVVIIRDPGTGDIAKEYTFEQFMDAWHDSNFEMISTVEPALYIHRY
ncbi:MAG: C39 family peptidase [Prochloraceae cyanobacterium]